MASRPVSAELAATLDATVRRLQRKAVAVQAALTKSVEYQPCRILATEQTGASALRDHEHDGHNGKRDTGDGEQPDGAEPQRHVAAGSQRTLQLALTLCADD